MTSGPGMLIVVADDFGAAASVNAAIAEAMRQGLISNTSLIPNGFAFDEACDLARREGWADRVGIHVALTEGAALSGPIRLCSRFCDDDGELWFDRFTHFRLTMAERSALTLEWQTQIDRCREAGIPLSHADSHHHCHAEFPLFSVLAPLLVENRVPFLRLSDNVRKVGLVRRLYKQFFNGSVARAGLAGTDYFCDADGIGQIRDAESKVIEMMVHPAFDQTGRLIDSGTGRLLADCLPAGLRLGHFAQLQRPAK